MDAWTKWSLRSFPALMAPWFWDSMSTLQSTWWYSHSSVACFGKWTLLQAWGRLCNLKASPLELINAWITLICPEIPNIFAVIWADPKVTALVEEMSTDFHGFYIKFIKVEEGSRSAVLKVMLFFNPTEPSWAYQLSPSHKTCVDFFSISIKNGIKMWLERIFWGDKQPVH